MKRCFQINPIDNVVTLLDDAEAEPVVVVRAGGGSGQNEIILKEKIALGHKAALNEISPNTPIIKFGIQIGISTQLIRSGEWVHLHNCASFVDARSSTLDLQTGRPSDTLYN